MLTKLWKESTRDKSIVAHVIFPVLIACLIKTLIHSVVAGFLCRGTSESKTNSNIVFYYASHHLFAKMPVPISPKLVSTASESALKKKFPRPPLKPTSYITHEWN